MNTKLTIAALAVMVPLIFSIGEARAESCGWFTPQYQCDLEEAQHLERVDAFRHFNRAVAEARDEEAAEDAAHPMTDSQRERHLCFATLPELRGGCDKRYWAEDEAATAAKRSTGELPQKDWRVAKPANDWKVSR